MEPSTSTAKQTAQTGTGEPRNLRNNRFLAKAKIRNNQISFKGDRGGGPTEATTNSAGSTTTTEQSNNTRKRTRDGSVRDSRNASRSEGTSSSKKMETVASLKPLPKRVRNFVDYDLSTMKNSKGGFLLENKDDDPRAIKQRQQIELLKNQRLQQAKRLNQDPSPSLSLSPYTGISRF
jgi:DNA-repair protein complementing XP-A cells